jgi:hypothetical protein
LSEEHSQRLISQTIPGLDHGPSGDDSPPRGQVGIRQDEIQMSHDLLDRSVAKQSHADDDPDDVLRRELSSTGRRGSGRLQGCFHPRRLDVAGEQLK